MFLLILYESEISSGKFSILAWAENESSEDILRNEGFHTIFALFCPLFFKTIRKLTDFFDALHQFNGKNSDSRPIYTNIQKSDFKDINGELSEICGLAKKLNATQANMGGSQLCKSYAA